MHRGASLVDALPATMLMLPNPEFNDIRDGGTSGLPKEQLLVDSFQQFPAKLSVH